jgi:hypothetical protein
VPEQSETPAAAPVTPPSPSQAAPATPESTAPVPANPPFAPQHRLAPAEPLPAALWRQRILVGTLVALLGIIGLGLLGHVPLAGGLLSVLLAVVAFLRIVLPTRVLGALVVRSTAIDVTVLLVLAVGIGALSVSPNL